MNYDIKKIKSDFPILNREVRPGVKLVYLDSTATAQKPSVVMDVMQQYYMMNNANIHRGIHQLAEEATAMYESAREKVASFIHAHSTKEIIFTRNATESINLVAQTWGRKFLHPGDVVILSEMEHHSNLVPWQMLAEEKDLVLEFIPVTENGELDLSIYDLLLDKNPKLVAFTHMSNVLGTVNPAKEIVQKAHDAGALVLIDGAQSVPHFSVDVTDLDADFYVFSAHKMVGPTGIGALYGKEKLLAEMPPFLGGGDMIKKVHLRSFKANDLPHKFEAGTPAIAEAIGFGKAIDYLSAIGMDNIAAHEREITQYALKKLQEVENLKVFCPAVPERGGVISFEMGFIHPHDVAQVLDHYGIAVRAGHHCAMPLHEKFGIPATSRASFYLYNDFEEVDLLAIGLQHVNEMFA
ncbi:MAG: cysteine desulfurase [Anaerolineaceae bacterium]|jgi:cysteine desulfurase/selenocysteine lyase|nr:cysteine desulfurase [Anaerolineaceae bacterium]